MLLQHVAVPFSFLLEEEKGNSKSQGDQRHFLEPGPQSDLDHLSHSSSACRGSWVLSGGEIQSATEGLLPAAGQLNPEPLVQQS